MASYALRPHTPSSQLYMYSYLLKDPRLIHTHCIYVYMHAVHQGEIGQLGMHLGIISVLSNRMLEMVSERSLKGSRRQHGAELQNDSLRQV